MRRISPVTPTSRRTQWPRWIISMTSKPLMGRGGCCHALEPTGPMMRFDDIEIF
jgi:hypothetical protein